MKFPITREQLHNIKKDVEEDVIEYNIDLIVNSIQSRVIAHAYSFCHHQYAGGAIPAVIGNYNVPCPTKLKIDIPQRFQIIIPDKWRPYMAAHYLALINPWKTHFEIIKQKFMELFPGVSFETDPLKTYILIDWS
jgi:hypothetical protein